ncbi:MAG TPA: HAD family hydrolase [Candidatus Eisenbacteria bacterium]|nr:HAD family hydrolase [Candidatus Eisenbacteria bacterium]
MTWGEPLPSWNDGPAKSRLLAFVKSVTEAGGKDGVAPPERIAVFDNDGTLWCEQPLYVQFVFALDRLKALAPQHPEWATTQPFQAALAGDEKAVAASGAKGLAEIMMATHAGMTQQEFAAMVADWIATARHPRFKRPYTELVYQPMLELLAYLRENGFKTFIVSGGGVDFMRVWTERVYGIPPEQVVGSTIATEFRLGPGGVPELIRLPKIDHVDDGPGKPVGIDRSIGRHPIFAFGNSDGDRQMLEWTAAGSGARFLGIVHHTDAAREWAYDHPSAVGQLDKALVEAQEKGWTVVDMKTEWKRVFAFE